MAFLKSENIIKTHNFKKVANEKFLVFGQVKSVSKNFVDSLSDLIFCFKNFLMCARLL